MKLSENSGFTWTIASTFVLALIISMTSLVANAGPPLANPPTGNASPTFTNLESTNDIIVGQNVKVGGDIRPKTGTSFALNADKVNFTKDIEVAGGGIVGKVLQVIGSIKGANGKPISLDGDAEVSGKFNIKGGSGDGIFIDNEKITRPAGALKLDGAVNITGALNALSATLGAIDTVSLNAFGPNGIRASSEANSFGGLYITKYYKDGTPPKDFGWLRFTENPDTVALVTKNDSGNIKIQGVTYEPIKNNISKLSGANLDLNFGSISTKAGADVTVNGALKVPTGNVVVGGNITATGEIGVWTSVDGPLRFVQGAGVNGASSPADCVMDYLVSCTLSTPANPTNITSAVNIVGNKCWVTASSTGNMKVAYYARALCFRGK